MPRALTKANDEKHIDLKYIYEYVYTYYACGAALLLTVYMESYKTHVATTFYSRQHHPNSLKLHTGQCQCQARQYKSLSLIGCIRV